MNKKILLMLISIVLLGGCATKIPVKSSNDDCLVVFKTTVTNPGMNSILRDYYFNIEGYSRSIKISNRPEFYTYILINEEGTLLKSVATSVDPDSAKGKDGLYIIDYKLPYKPGGMVIADYIFNQKYTEVKDNSFLSEFQFLPFKPKEKQALYNELSSKEEFQDWAK